MKIAICFFGIIRSLEYVIDSIQDNIFDVLKKKGYEYDVYMHTYRSKNLPPIDDTYLKLGPKEIIIDDQDKFDEDIKDEPIITECCNKWFKAQQNYTRAVNSIQKVTTMWENSGIYYDAVMLIRPDCMYLNPINTRLIDRLMHNNKIIFVPRFHCFRGYNDRFALGSPITMKYFGKQLDGIRNYNCKEKIVAETFIKHFANSLIKNGLLLRVQKSDDIFFLRIRANKSIARNDLRLLQRTDNDQIKNNYEKYKKNLI